jgi:Calcineurin-like phosphoesterase
LNQDPKQSSNKIQFQDTIQNQLSHLMIRNLYTKCPQRSYTFQYLSDLHLERNPIPKIPQTAEYLCLAGDIGHPEEHHFQSFISTIKSYYTKVFFTPGNHEYYQRFKKGQSLKTKEELDTYMHTLCDSLGNVEFMQQRMVPVDQEKKLYIAGTTLWGNPLNRPLYPSFDYKNIYTQHLDSVEPMKESNYYEYHQQSVSFIKSMKKEQQGKPIIMMTHHIPSYRWNTPKHLKSNYIHFYCNHLDHLIGPPFVAWITGHSHGAMNMQIHGVPCYRNAIGHSKEIQHSLEEIDNVSLTSSMFTITV